MIFTWENIQATRLGYRVEQTRREIRSLKITNEYLHYRLESALSPARLHLVAQKRLGMVAPDLGKIIVLSPSAFGEGLPVTDKFADAGLPGRLSSAFGEGPVTARDDTRHRLPDAGLPSDQALKDASASPPALSRVAYRKDRHAMCRASAATEGSLEAAAFGEGLHASIAFHKLSDKSTPNN